MEKLRSSTREVRDSIIHGQATSGPYYSAIVEYVISNLPGAIWMPSATPRRRTRQHCATTFLERPVYKPTVSPGVTYAVVDTCGRDDGRIAPTHCVLIDGRLGGRWSRYQVCRTPPAEARSARSGLAAGSRRASTAAPGGFLRSRTTQR